MHSRAHPRHPRCLTQMFVGDLHVMKIALDQVCAVQYFIPILGMLLGNGISGVSVGLTALLEEFTVGAHSLL